GRGVGVPPPPRNPPPPKPPRGPPAPERGQMGGPQSPPLACPKLLRRYANCPRYSLNCGGTLLRISALRASHSADGARSTMKVIRPPSSIAIGSPSLYRILLDGRDETRPPGVMIPTRFSGSAALIDTSSPGFGVR